MNNYPGYLNITVHVIEFTKITNIAIVNLHRRPHLTIGV